MFFDKCNYFKFNALAITGRFSDVSTGLICLFCAFEN